MCIIISIKSTKSVEQSSCIDNLLTCRYHNGQGISVVDEQKIYLESLLHVATIKLNKNS